MGDYIYPAPGVTGTEVTCTLDVNANASDTGLALAGLQDMTINAANDIFSWEQLDAAAKKQIATTATNSVSMNLVVNQTEFFGTGAATDTAAGLGVFGLSKNKTKIGFSIFLGKEDDGSAGKTVTGVGYITGLSPSVSSSEPVWVTPITITVDGDYTVS